MTNWVVQNYRDARGALPVNDTLKSLPSDDYARVLRAIDLLVDYGPALKMPHAQHLEGKIWELRIDGRPNSYRVLYAAMPGRKFILLHLFAKKSQKTPPREIDTARRRLKDYSERTTL